MTQLVPMEQNFLAALLHGRRSRLAEAGRLDDLCRIRTVPELARVLYPGATVSSAAELQRRMAAGVLDELNGLAGGVEGDRRAFLPWLRVRFQVENLKVLARGRASRMTLESVQPHLMALPRDLKLDLPKLMAADSPAAFCALIPNPVLCKRLRKAGERLRALPDLFWLEAALDQAYLGELLFRAQGLAGEDRPPVLAAVRQEVDLFHLMLAVRGKSGYGMKPDALVELYVPGSALTRQRFAAMLAARDLAEVAELAQGRAVDARPEKAGPAELETLAWNRLLRLANQAFRAGHMSLGAVAGYTLLRRVELANLITLCEGLRLGVAPGVLRARLIPRAVAEAVYV